MAFGPNPRALMDPVLQKIDVLLDDDALVDGVLERMKERWPKSSRRGRYGTPAEVALRMLVLKHLRDLSYEHNVRDVEAMFAIAAQCASRKLNSAPPCS